MTSQYPIADILLPVIGVDPTLVRSVSYYIDAENGTESCSVALTEEAVATIKTVLGRYPGASFNYEARPDTQRCANCSNWEATGDGQGLCGAFATTSPLAGRVITPNDLYCTNYQAVDSTRHGVYQPAPTDEHDTEAAA